MLDQKERKGENFARYSIIFAFLLAHICSALRAPQMFRFFNFNFLSDASRPYAFAASLTLRSVSILGKFSKIFSGLRKLLSLHTIFRFHNSRVIVTPAILYLEIFPSFFLLRKIFQVFFDPNINFMGSVPSPLRTIHKKAKILQTNKKEHKCSRQASDH